LGAILPKDEADRKEKNTGRPVFRKSGGEREGAKMEFRFVCLKKKEKRGIKWGEKEKQKGVAAG